MVPIAGAHACSWWLKTCSTPRDGWIALWSVWSDALPNTRRTGPTPSNFRPTSASTPSSCITSEGHSLSRWAWGFAWGFFQPNPMTSCIWHFTSQVFNASPDETAQFRHVLFHNPVGESLIMIQPTLVSPIRSDNHIEHGYTLFSSLLTL